MSTLSFGNVPEILSLLCCSLQVQRGFEIFWLQYTCRRRNSGIVKYIVDIFKCYYDVRKINSVSISFGFFIFTLTTMNFIGFQKEQEHSVLPHLMFFVVGSFGTVLTLVEVRMEANFYRWFKSCWLALTYSGIVSQHPLDAVSPSLVRAG